MNNSQKMLIFDDQASQKTCVILYLIKIYEVSHTKQVDR